MLDGRLAQLVRASALQAEGHKFESCIVHHAGVAQLVRASACHAEGRAFKSRHSRHLAIPFSVTIPYMFHIVWCVIHSCRSFQLFVVKIKKIIKRIHEYIRYKISELSMHCLQNLIFYYLLNQLFNCYSKTLGVIKLKNNSLYNSQAPNRQ